jgi:hypothetical protein
MLGNMFTQVGSWGKVRIPEGPQALGVRLRIHESSGLRPRPLLHYRRTIHLWCRWSLKTINITITLCWILRKPGPTRLHGLRRPSGHTSVRVPSVDSTLSTHLSQGEKIVQLMLHAVILNWC